MDDDSCINPFFVNIPILNTMKTQENIWLSLFFNEYKMGTFVKNGLKN